MKMKEIIYGLILVVVAAVTVYSCKHSPDSVMTPITPPPGGSTSQLCFETDILPIFQTNCAKSGCHDVASHEKDYIFDSYSNIMRKDVRPGDATNSKVYKVLFETGNDKMPPPPNVDLTVAQKALIGRWINEGAKNTTGCSTGCDTLQFKYAANIRPILDNYCIGCHGGATPSANLDFTSYNIVRSQAINGRLPGAITHSAGYSPMPKNSPKLSECQITQVKKWIAAGAQNN
jgi:hypothetical protein